LARRCRSISFGSSHGASFLCAECGYCAYGSFAFEVNAAPASDAVAIVNEVSRVRVEEQLEKLKTELGGLQAEASAAVREVLSLSATLMGGLAKLEEGRGKAGDGKEGKEGDDGKGEKKEQLHPCDQPYLGVGGGEESGGGEDEDKKKKEGGGGRRGDLERERSALIADLLGGGGLGASAERVKARIRQTLESAEGIGDVEGLLARIRVPLQSKAKAAAAATKKVNKKEAKKGGGAEGEKEERSLLVQFEDARARAFEAVGQVQEFESERAALQQRLDAWANLDAGWVGVGVEGGVERGLGGGGGECRACIAGSVADQFKLVAKLGSDVLVSNPKLALLLLNGSSGVVTEAVTALCEGDAGLARMMFEAADAGLRVLAGAGLLTVASVGSRLVVVKAVAKASAGEKGGEGGAGGRVVFTGGVSERDRIASLLLYVCEVCYDESLLEVAVGILNDIV